MTRVSFLVDGFNLYHSVCDSMQDQKLSSGKWLNIRALLGSFISVFGRDAVVHEIYYFSALAYHVKDQNAPIRHMQLIKALRSTGVKDVLGQFKRKEIRCRAVCQKKGFAFEEKETDVNIAVTLIELVS